MSRPAWKLMAWGLFAIALCGQPLLGGPVFRGLGSLPDGGISSEARAVSANGAVVVGVGRFDSGSEPFRWTAATGMVGLGRLPGAGVDTATGVSGDGSIVVGQSGRAFRWSEANGMVELTSAFSFASDVSADGSVIVGAVYPDSGWEPFRWTQPEGTVTLFGDTGGTWNEAGAVSADGSVVAGSRAIDEGSYEAFRWTAAEGVTGLGDLPGGTLDSAAFGISDDGSTIVGSGRSAYGLEAFRWTAETGIDGLGDLPGGAYESVANDTSEDGSVVVGYGSGQSGHQALIWDRSTGMRDLQNLLANDFSVDLSGWTLHSATGVSADGLTVVGYGTNPDGHREAWIARIPEPATLSLLLVAAVLYRPGRRTRSMARGS